MAILVILGLGIRQLSIGGASLARAKQVICGLTIEEAQKLAQAVLQMGTQQEITQCLERFAKKQKEET